MTDTCRGGPRHTASSAVTGLLTLVLAGAACLAACVPAPPATIIDGWAVGEAKVCPAGDERCFALLPEASRGLDRRDPGHPPVVRATLHEEGAYRSPGGSILLPIRSGDCCDVAVFELADGTTRAIGVGYPGISQVPMAIDYGLAITGGEP